VTKTQSKQVKELAETLRDLRIVSATHPGIVALRKALKERRDDEQGGYSGYCGGGKWSFAATSVGHFTPEEYNALFDLVGIVPDEVPVKGHCEDCKFAKPCEKEGFVTFHGQGYVGPCLTCKGASMSNFKPRKKFPENRGFWCYQCGKVFAKVEDRDDHVALLSIRQKRGAGTCA